MNGAASERLVYKSPGPTIEPWAVTPDGTTAIISVGDGNDVDLATLPLNGGEPTPLIARPGQQTAAQLSPDGRWLAYTSTEAGRPEVFVERFPERDMRYQVSTNGGRIPRWRADGRELWFTSASTGVVSFLSVSVDAQGQGLRLGTPAKRFENTPPNTSHRMALQPYALTGDGSRLLVTRRPKDDVVGTAANGITVVMNWQMLLPPPTRYTTPSEAARRSADQRAAVRKRRSSEPRRRPAT